MIIDDAISFFIQMDFLLFVKVFWFFLLFDVSRYALSFLPILFGAFVDKLTVNEEEFDVFEYDGRVNILMAGHNEGSQLRRSVESLQEQTFKGFKIVVVDDGSMDNMAEVARQLEKEGLIDTFIHAGIRGGKASGLNLGLKYCDRDFVLCMDIDTSLDRNAIEEMLKPMSDQTVAAVSGNLAVRNKYDSLMTRFQAIEYLGTISVGRRFTSLMDILGIVSGAFGLFRRDAILQVGAWEVGPGDDSDLTNRLRRAGWKIRFAYEATALTAAPVTFMAYFRQRVRWNRSIIRVRLRKFGVNFNPFSPMFSLSNVMSVINVLYFQVLSSLFFYIYLIWSLVNFKEYAVVILCVTSIIYLFEGLVLFIIVCFLYPEREPVKLGIYILGQSLFSNFIMRGVRLYAYADEFLFRNSYNDSFYPSKVRNQLDKF